MASPNKMGSKYQFLHVKDGANDSTEETSKRGLRVLEMFLRSHTDEHF